MYDNSVDFMSCSFREQAVTSRGAKVFEHEINHIDGAK